MNTAFAVYPLAYLDDDGRIVIVGKEAYRQASWVGDDRAIPDSWTLLIPSPKEPQ